MQNSQNRIVAKISLKLKVKGTLRYKDFARNQNLYLAEYKSPHYILFIYYIISTFILYLNLYDLCIIYDIISQFVAACCVNYDEHKIVSEIFPAPVNGNAVKCAVSKKTFFFTYKDCVYGHLVFSPDH